MARARALQQAPRRIAAPPGDRPGGAGFAGSRGVRLLTLVGIFEVCIALWMLSGRRLRTCAAVQTVALLAMNITELTYARPLLLWPAGLLPLNLVFLGIAWTAAGWRGPARLQARLRRHPVAIRAHFDECLTLTYALPAATLQPLLPPGLELETVNGQGFIAVALVQTRALRPDVVSAGFGQDFFLSGYRIFTRFKTREGRSLRGLRILRSDTDRSLMQFGGNLLTHYNYHRCAASVRQSARSLEFVVRTTDGSADLNVRAHLDEHTLPPGSPFASTRQALRFAGPLPFTFDYERETHAIIAIQAARANWHPQPVAVDVERIVFFDQPPFHGCKPCLAAAFHVADIDYRWERGVRHAL